MPKFNVDVTHNQNRDEVIKKLRSFMQSALQDAAETVSEVEETWDENDNLNFAFSAMGFRVSGKMVTDDEKITVGGELPFAALPFRGALEKQLAGKLNEAIA